MHSCKRCGSDLSPGYSRVFGNNDGIVHACLHCTRPKPWQNR